MISTTAKSQVFGQEGGGFIELVTIDHPSLSSPLRFANDNQNVVSRGDTFLAYPFTVKLPTERDRSVPSANLIIDNVSQSIGATLRTITTAPTVLIEIVRMDDTDVVEASFPLFEMRNVEVNALSISGELLVVDIMREPFPQRNFTPSEYPGLFQR